MTLHSILAQAAEPGMVEKFGLEPKLVALQVFGFLVLAAVLYWAAIKPILATMGERVTKIEAGLKYTEEMKAKLEAAQAAYDAKLKEAQTKASQVIIEAQNAAKALTEKQLQEAIEQANGLISKAQTSIELEKKKMLADARVEISRLVIATTQRVLSTQLSDADRAKYNEAATRELSQV